MSRFIDKIDDSRVSKWANRRPFLTSLGLATVVIFVSVFTLTQKDDDLESTTNQLEQTTHDLRVAQAQIRDLAQCGRSYARSAIASTLPVRKATAKLQRADGRLWHSLWQAVKRAPKKPNEFEIKRRIAARVHLYTELRQARKQNPYPPPPETFCAR